MRSKRRCSCVLQFTRRRAFCCVLHRPTSQVIHRSGYCLSVSPAERRGVSLVDPAKLPVIACIAPVFFGETGLENLSSPFAGAPSPRGVFSRPFHGGSAWKALLSGENVFPVLSPPRVHQVRGGSAVPRGAPSWNGPFSRLRGWARPAESQLGRSTEVRRGRLFSSLLSCGPFFSRTDARASEEVFWRLELEPKADPPLCRRRVPVNSLLVSPTYAAVTPGNRRASGSRGSRPACRTSARKSYCG